MELVNKRPVKELRKDRKFFLDETRYDIARFSKDLKMKCLGVAFEEAVRDCDDADALRIAILIDTRAKVLGFEVDVEKNPILSRGLKNAAAEELELQLREIDAGPFADDNCTPEQFNAEMKSRYGV
jgi:UDP-N-acetyl-D-mannosaminuronate dehydrogenase